MLEVSYKFIRYFLTGGSAAILDAGGFVLLTEMRLPATSAAIVSFCVAAIANYHFTRRFVFKRDYSGRGLILFLIAATIGLAVNVSITLISMSLLGLGPLEAKVMGIGAAFLLNFALNAAVVFRY